MTLRKRLCAPIFSASVLCAAALAAPAAADAARPLSDTDAHAYAAAFQAVDQGDFVGAQISAAEIKDRSLDGYLSFRALMHPSAHTATFEELSAWLARFRDLPLADRVFSLASKRRPAEAPPPPMPQVALVDTARSEVTRPAREAFYSGDAKTAFRLAVEVGERWVAGLSAWRLGDHAQALDYFSQVARDPDEDAWARSGGAYWAARAADALGDAAQAEGYLRLAADASHTFYGMIAARQLPGRAEPPARFIPAAFQPPRADITPRLAADPRAHRAAALAQIGRFDEARQELRAGLVLARSADERRAWNQRLNSLQPIGRSAIPAGVDEYPLPELAPRGGFTIDRALVYAIVRQESRFNPRAISHAGAMGLMQVLPTTATLASGDRSFTRRPRMLLEPAVNLRVGQDYLAYLMDRGVGPDLLKVIAAYNAGPGAVANAVARVGDDDPLLLIETLPALETRNYVERVMAGYWTYKRMLGEETRSLDALAAGARRIDARLDLPDPPRPDAPGGSQEAAQPLEIGALGVGQGAARH